MINDFDVFIERGASGCVKWNWFERDVLPMWVADMDFRAPQAVIDALHARVDHGIFGYHLDEPTLRDVLVDRLRVRHALEVSAEQIAFLPGLVMGLNFVSHIVGAPGEAVLTMTPIYPPFLSSPKNQGRTVQINPLVATRTGSRLEYAIDFDALEAAVTPQTRLLLLCSPHNPAGRAWTRAELERIADLCLRHDLVICSDEIHCDLVYPGTAHLSIAALAPEVAARTITLIAPSKTFNIPGLGMSAAVITNPELLKRMNEWRYAMGAFVNAMGLTAGLAAYQHGDAWLEAALAYLRVNRDLVFETIAVDMPALACTVPEATYLTWIDCRDLPLAEGVSPAAHFLEVGRVAFNDGAMFGEGGQGFVRLNFATPRATLVEGLARMKRAYDAAMASAG